MKKKWISLVSLAIMLILCITHSTYVRSLSVEQSLNPVFVKEELHSGDAKIWGNYIITSVSGHLCIYDFSGNLVKEYPQIKSAWLDGIYDKRIIIYSNFENKTGLLVLDENLVIIESRDLILSESLYIDPAIISIEDGFYFTLTEIIGTVNNADVNVQNGNYTIKLFKMDSEYSIDYIGGVYSDNCNLEDVSILYNNQKLYVVFEKEDVDKGDSAICLVSSSKKSEFTDWSELRILLASDCDHEPAEFEIDALGYIKLYYSCDRDMKGSSYMGASMYYAVWNKKLELIAQDIPINSEISGGKLFYDITTDRGKMYFLYARDYLKTNDLVLECICN